LPYFLGLTSAAGFAPYGWYSSTYFAGLVREVFPMPVGRRSFVVHILMGLLREPQGFFCRGIEQPPPLISLMEAFLRYEVHAADKRVARMGLFLAGMYQILRLLLNRKLILPLYSLKYPSGWCMILFHFFRSFQRRYSAHLKTPRFWHRGIFLA